MNKKEEHQQQQLHEQEQEDMKVEVLGVHSYQESS